MSVKIKQALANCVGQIKNKTFDEDTIRTLLIVSREYLDESSGVLKELAHFIAHPIRDRGICHAKVNNRYAKFKLADDQYHKLDDPAQLLTRIRTEKELSEYLLGGVQVDKIEAKLFEVLYFDGIQDISEKHLIKYCGMKRKQAIKLLRSSYVKQDGLYYLKAERFKHEIDRLQRVIRGTIEYSSVFDSTELNREVERALRKVTSVFALPSGLIPAIKDNKNDIQLCIMTLLHDSTFTFYDENTARTFMCMYLEPPRDKEGDLSDYYTSEMMYEHGTIALYITYKYYDKTNSIPLFVSGLRIKEYLDASSRKELGSTFSMAEIPWTTAKRIDGKLRLVLTA